MSAPAHTNALIDETSPYLRQHAHNPVDWKPWGPAALDEARRENKLIFLSIGYAACHWCHVMEHESFENEDVADLLNRHFVPIKVDREERPDLDEIYMTATMVFSGGGGWPMSVFLSPDLKPVFAGTYFPPQDAYGRPGFMTVLRFLAERWQKDPESLTGDSEKVLDVIRRMHAGGEASETELTPEQIREAADQVYRVFDKERGGIPSGSNKFPSTLAVDLMLRVWRRTGEKRYLEIAELTLEKLGNGGIYDHLGGGVHRYATDVRWLVPHFEKMLYDQALVVRAYCDLWQATAREDLKALAQDRARGICDYVLHDLTSPEGGFYSSEDADSEGQEGKFYIWTREEVFELAGDELSAKLFCSRYDVSQVGNWMHPGDAHVPAGPKNVLQIVRDVETLAKLESLEPEEVERRLADVSAKLLAARNERVRPALDDKILSGWNGLMIAAMARAAAVFEEPRYTEAAARAADFALDHMLVDGRLRAAYGGGRAKLTAYASDYAFLIEGLLALFEATGELERLKQAERLTETLIRHYWDSDDGGFYFTADDHEELLVRSKTSQDGATPSANSVMVGNLLKLASLLDRRELAERADQTVRAFSEGARLQPFQAERLLAEAEALADGLTEIVVVGAADDGATRALLRAVWDAYLPAKVVAWLDPDSPRPDGALFAGRETIDGVPAAYVCRHFVCERPAVSPDELRAQLAASKT